LKKTSESQVPKKKLIHFRENHSFPHLFQLRYHELKEDFSLKSHWNQDFFYNFNPIILELGCGNGEYTVELAGKYPERNFIGMDLKGARLWRGCKTVQENGMKNVAFIRSMIDYIEKFFGENEISEIWITFPDPHPRKERKRLTASVFLERYHKIIIPGGIIHLKTDNAGFFSYTLGIIGKYNYQLLEATDDLYHSEITGDAISVQTYYEKIWLEKSKKICYLKFRMR
jgi:tRNA (guanine-N7-)-methyltransferase